MQNEKNNQNYSAKRNSGHSTCGMRFVNPYNFVPLAGSAPSREEDNGGGTECEEGLLTGRIDYTLTTRTPLFIPNTSNDRIFGIRSTDEKAEDEKNYHKNYDFCSYNDLSREGSNTENRGKYYEPVIPGSEIRGAVRSIYEALTDSCLPTMQKPSAIARRTPETYKAGVLVWENNKIVLRGEEGNGIPKNDLIYRDPHNKYNASFCDQLRKEGFRDGAKVWFKRTRRSKGRDLINEKSDISLTRPQEWEKNGWEEGWIILGMPGPAIKNDKGIPNPLKIKHCAHIFTAEDAQTQNNHNNKKPGIKKLATFADPDGIQQETSYSSISALRNNLCSVIKAYQDNNPDAYAEYKESAENFFNQRGEEGLPVYYSKITKGVYYFSPACITREAYYRKLDQCVKGYAACEDTNHLCPACSLFGMLNQNTGMGRGSRVRFSDAYLSSDTIRFNSNFKSCYKQIVTLPELAAPKIQSTEFYLQKPRGVGRLMNWTYDYYIYLDNDVPKIHWYKGESDDAPVIAGRKFYWHSQKAYKKNVLDRQAEFKAAAGRLPGISKGRTIRNQTVRPVREGISFSGHLYFDGVRKTELDRLIAIMNMSAKGNVNRGKPHYAIKLGTGKPMGMGSADLTVDKVICRKVSFTSESGYTETAYKAESIQVDDKSLFRDTGVLKYLDYDALQGTRITGYPGTENWPNEGSEGFQWFMKNRQSFSMRKGGAIDLEKTTKSPNSRKQIHFEKHMQSMETQTVGNSVKAKSSDNRK